MFFREEEKLQGVRQVEGNSKVVVKRREKLKIAMTRGGKLQIVCEEEEKLLANKKRENSKVFDKRRENSINCHNFYKGRETPKCGLRGGKTPS